MESRDHDKVDQVKKTDKKDVSDTILTPLILMTIGVFAQNITNGSSKLISAVAILIIVIVAFIFIKIKIITALICILVLLLQMAYTENIFQHIQDTIAKYKTGKPIISEITNDSEETLELNNVSAFCKDSVLSGTTWKYVDSTGNTYTMFYDIDIMKFKVLDKNNYEECSVAKRCKYSLSGTILTITEEDNKRNEEKYKYLCTRIENISNPMIVYRRQP